MSVHRIRLRAPWQQASLACGAVRWTRSFHRPTNLRSTDRVWLVVSAAPADGTAELNGQALGRLTVSGDAHFDVTALLASHNALVLALTGPSPPAASSEPPVQVALEIVA